MNPSRVGTFVGLATIIMGVSACGIVPEQRARPTLIPVVADDSGVTAEGRLEPVRFASLSPVVEGLVAEVFVTEGEQVDEGQLIARINSSTGIDLVGARTNAAEQLGSAYEAVRIAQNEFDNYPVPREFVGFTPQEAAQVWLQELDDARDAFEPYKDTSRKALKPRHALPNLVYPSLPQRVVVDTGEYQGVAKEVAKRVDVAWANYTKAVEWLKLDAALDMAQARLSNAQRRYDGLHDASFSSATAGVRAALADAEIRAPFGGTITELSLKVGEVVSPGSNAATVADLSSWVVKTEDLTEIDVVGLQPGMPVTITLDALPSASFSGRVLAIDLGYSDRDGDIIYTSTLLISDPNPAMRWGMTAQVSFGR
jgi:HlyD family secretion protein